MRGFPLLPPGEGLGMRGFPLLPPGEGLGMRGLMHHPLRPALHV